MSLHSLVTVGTAVIDILCAVVVLVKQFWLVGFAIILVSIYQIGFICTMGATFESRCDRFEQRLNSFKWNNLRVPQQKKFILVLQMAQRPKLLSIGNIADANFNTFLKVRLTGIGSKSDP